MADEVGVDVTRRRFLRLPDPGWAMLTVLAAAAYAPASLYATQSRLLARGYRLAFVVILVFIVLTGLSAVLARVLPTRTGAAWFAVAVFWFLFSSGRGLAGSFGAAGVLGLAVLGAICVLALGLSNWLNTVMVGFTALLILAPTLTMAQRPTLEQSEVTLASGEIDVSAVAYRPDIWVLVVDGYPSGWAMENVFGADAPKLYSTLDELGFVVEPNSLAAYSRTVGALPSILDGRMVIPAGATVGVEEELALGEMIGGESLLVRGLSDAGYAVTMVEAGWHQSVCGTRIDRCVRSGVYDDMLSSLVAGSLAPSLFGVDPDLGTRFASQRTFSVLEWLAAEENGSPRLILAHSLIPHPPMLLDRECRPRGSSAQTSGRVLGLRELDPAIVRARGEAFVDQVRCVDALVEGWLEEVPADDVVIVVGDHGSELLGQAGLPPVEWTSDMVKERLLTLAAVRFPGCDVDTRAGVTVVPSVLNCLGIDAERPTPQSMIIPNVAAEDGALIDVWPVEGSTLDELTAVATGERS